MPATIEKPALIFEDLELRIGVLEETPEILDGSYSTTTLNCTSTSYCTLGCCSSGLTCSCGDVSYCRC